MSIKIYQMLSNMVRKQLQLDAQFNDLFCYLYGAIEQGHLAVRIDPETCLPPLDSIFDRQDDKLHSRIFTAFKKLDFHDIEPFIYKQGPFLMLKKHFDLQMSIRQNFENLIDRDIEPLTGEINQLDDCQQKAIEAFKKQSVLLLTGGPGTGKTHIASFMVNLLAKNKKQAFVYLLAPTGLAFMLLKSSITQQLQKELEASLIIKAGTLHRLIPNFRKIKIYADLVIVDEASMIDAQNFDRLLKAIGPKTRLVILGDPMQLPSIEFGSIFTDLVRLAHDKRVHLTKVYRQESQEILKLAELISRQDNEKFLSFLTSKLDSVRYFEEDNLVSIFLKQIEAVYSNPEQAFASLHQSKILTPVKEGYFGTRQINQRVFRFMKEKGCVEIFVPIMVTRNQLNQQVFNGDLAVVKLSQKNDYSLMEGTGYFMNDDHELVEKPMHEIKAFELAYAISIHKSQGSGFDIVYLVMPDGAKRFGRQILYTAVTRAKKFLYLWGRKEAYLEVLQKDIIRHSALHT